MTITIPKRRVTFDIEGKTFEATELSQRYLMDAILNPDTDTVEAALADALPDLSDDDLRYFGKDTREAIYYELVKFTYKPALTREDRETIAKETGMSEAEILSLSRDAQLQLRNVIAARKPADPSKKKRLLKMMARMIRHGHSDLMHYGYSFFEAASEELLDSEKEAIVNAAFAHRVSQAKDDDWKKFVRKHTPSIPKKERVTDHKANIAAIRRMSRG